MEYQELFFSQTLYLDHSQGDLAKFGYGLDMKIKKFEESFSYFGYLLEPNVEIWQN
jgi:hypothetical protein